MSELNDLKDKLTLAHAQIRNLEIESEELREKLHRDRRFEAAKSAMQGLLSHYGYGRDGDHCAEDLARLAVDQADLLLKALEKQ